MKEIEDDNKDMVEETKIYNEQYIVCGNNDLLQIGNQRCITK